MKKIVLAAALAAGVTGGIATSASAQLAPTSLGTLGGPTLGVAIVSFAIVTSLASSASATTTTN